MQHTFWIHFHWTDVLDRDNPATLPIQLCDIAERKLEMDLIVAEMKQDQIELERSASFQCSMFNVQCSCSMFCVLCTVGEVA